MSRTEQVSLAGRPWRALAPGEAVTLWVFLLFAVLYVSLTRGHFISADEVSLFQSTRSLWEQGNVSVSSDCPHSVRGPDGRYFSPYNAGQSLAALPFYGLGYGVAEVLDGLKLPRAAQALAGRVRGGTQVRWGGDVEIFFVNLLNAWLTALLCAVFFATCLRLGASGRSSLTATALLGLTSHVASFSSGFYAHAGAALQLALALEATGRVPEAEAVWRRVLEDALRAGDEKGAEVARERLRRSDG